MNNPMNSNASDTNSSTVKDRVFTVIEEQGVEPRARYVFWCQNWLVWALWGVSIVVGALSVAVLAFASTHQYYALYEASHDNFVTFFFDVLPLLWFGVFAGLLVLAAWQLRRTKRGYRFSLSVLGGSSLIFSLMLGGLFHLGGFGFVLDKRLGEIAPMYESQLKMERKIWQNPAEGRLIGMQRGAAQSSTSVQFIDTAGQQWTVTVTDLTEADVLYLAEGNRVRLLGAQSTSQVAEFYACGVFPWMLDGPMPMKQVSEARQDFVDQMYYHHDNAMARRQAIEASLAAGNAREESVPDSPCHSLPAITRMHEDLAN